MSSGNMMDRRGRRTLTGTMVALALVGCGDGGTTGPTGPAERDLRIAIVSGDGQRGWGALSLKGPRTDREGLAPAP